MDWTFGILAILAGSLTVLSPCILPILPPLLSASVAGRLRHRPFWIVLGLAISFTLFGVVFALFGSFLGLSNAALRNAALAVLFFFGLSLLLPRLWERIGSRISALAQRIPGVDRIPSEQGRINALLIGGSLGLVWAPCAGPILGIILTLATIQSSFIQTLILMSAYTLGAAGPMLLIGYGGRSVSQRLLSFRSWGALSHKLLGLLTLVTVVGLTFNLDTLFLARLPVRLFIANQIEKRLAGEASPVPPAPNDPAENGFGPDAALAATKRSPLPVLGTMPEFTKITAWFNSAPLTSAGLRGKVVLIDFWTYSCINCIRTLPTVARWHEKYKEQGLVIVGVHTPEFNFEKNESNVKQAISRHGIRYPVALDNDYGTWNAYRNHYWPAKYLIDAQGKLRKTHFGEGDEDEFERAIQSLLQEARLLHGPMEIEPERNAVDFSKIRSPETYVGYNREERFSSPERIAPDTTQNYSIPASLRLNGWALGGPWKIIDEAAILQAPQGRIQFRFQAPKLNLVMKGNEKGVVGKVLLDGRPIPENLRGADVGPDGKVTILDAKLYNLVTLPKEDEGEHLFELIFENRNVELYAFTFG